MKKILAISISVLFISVAVIPAFAQAKQHKKAEVAIEVIHGTIASIDMAKKEIVVQDQKTGQNKTFVVSGKVISALKAGEKVKVKVKAGSNVAESVKVVNPEPKKK